MSHPIVPFRPVVLDDRPIGAKLQVIAMLDPNWVHALELIVDWKLAELKHPDWKR